MAASSNGASTPTAAAELGVVDPHRNGSPAAPSGRLARVKREWQTRLDPENQSLVISWASFTTTFVGVRLLTHWIRDGHGPKGGGMSVGGNHFHHYNLGIALLGVVGAVGLRGSEERRRHPATATAYGSALALIVDEFALLLDLKNVYWKSDGRKSVDTAVTMIAAGATLIIGRPFWTHARRALRSR
jgi:hypothetical protein